MPFFWVDDWAEKGFFYSVNVELSGRPLAAGPLQRRVGRLADTRTRVKGPRRCGQVTV